MPGVIDGRRWLRQRIAHLEAALAADPPDDQRARLQTELDAARAELRRARSWSRWLRGSGAG
jgi:hypothetical protein